MANDNKKIIALSGGKPTVTKEAPIIGESQLLPFRYTFSTIYEGFAFSPDRETLEHDLRDKYEKTVKGWKLLILEPIDLPPEEVKEITDSIREENQPNKTQLN
jgi:hypothetical protein